MNPVNLHKRIMDTISGVSILTFPILLLIGFLSHPDILSLEQVRTPEQLANNFHNNTMWHIGHLIVAFAIPFIIFSIMHFMNLLKEKGLRYGIIGGIGLAFFREYFDHSFTDPDQLEQDTGLVVFGTVNEMKKEFETLDSVQN